MSVHRAMRFVFGAAVILLASGVATAHNYIGAERCKGCHEFANKVWSRGPHAAAHQALSEEQLGDPKCNTCHTMLAEKQETRFLGVQCERCHGGGRYYHREYVMKDVELSRAVGLVDPKPDHCKQCHTEGAPSIELFDFEKMWKRIDHGKEARLAWEKSRATKSEDEKAVTKP